jgi:hypothetical protein
LRFDKRIAEEVPVVHVDDVAELEKRRIGRPAPLGFPETRLRDSRRKTDLSSLEILRRVREADYQGGKTALYALVASVRPQEIKPLIRFEGLPGEFSQHDFGEVDDSPSPLDFPEAFHHLFFVVYNRFRLLF